MRSRTKINETELTKREKSMKPKASSLKKIINEEK